MGILFISPFFLLQSFPFHLAGAAIRRRLGVENIEQCWWSAFAVSAAEDD